MADEQHLAAVVEELAAAVERCEMETSKLGANHEEGFGYLLTEYEELAACGKECADSVKKLELETGKQSLVVEAMADNRHLSEVVKTIASAVCRSELGEAAASELKIQGLKNEQLQLIANSKDWTNGIDELQLKASKLEEVAEAHQEELNAAVAAMETTTGALTRALCSLAQETDVLRPSEPLAVYSGVNAGGGGIVGCGGAAVGAGAATIFGGGAAVFGASGAGRFAHGDRFRGSEDDFRRLAARECAREERRAAVRQAAVDAERRCEAVLRGVQECSTEAQRRLSYSASSSSSHSSPSRGLVSRAKEPITMQDPMSMSTDSENSRTKIT
eukprot:TRINITY_DN10960_c0_g3_i1.p1 TRINITY_DN10960_c0_g3~~TRINITY_DN10960_c0_g3_i1.p1  ORF type:complete len:385 (-),score=109.46 TRINITY_DN10960_c0_g3_i1:145-1137(-)